MGHAGQLILAKHYKAGVHREVAAKFWGSGQPSGSERRRVSGPIGLSSKTGRMNEQIKAQLDAKPFKRFSIETNDGRSIEVPHPDHVIVGRFAVTIEDDDGIIRILAYRNISGLTIPTGNGE